MTDAFSIIKADKLGYDLFWLDGKAWFFKNDEKHGPFDDMDAAARNALMHHDEESFELQRQSEERLENEIYITDH